ncbi:MAG: hypothetical protein HGB28_01060 [Oscillochloris sp.]|nr:hypothetical protein [Oscillochloris sp.]
MIKPSPPDEEIVVPPLPGWLAPAAVALSALLGLATWVLWGFAGPLSSLAEATWLFLCR